MHWVNGQMSIFSPSMAGYHAACIPRKDITSVSTQMWSASSSLGFLLPLSCHNGLEMVNEEHPASQIRLSVGLDPNTATSVGLSG